MRVQLGRCRGRSSVVAIGAAMLLTSEIGTGPRSAVAEVPDALKAVFTRPTPAPPSKDLAARVALGRTLFGDRRLSAGGETSCASCHTPERGFTDGRRVARGRGGVALDWHTPTLWNLAEDRAFFWNGRVASLEAQARDVIAHPKEMGLPLDDAAQRFAADPRAVQAFAQAFGRLPDGNGIVTALADYVRSLRSPETTFDRVMAGTAQFSAREARGFEIFTGKGRCLGCHGGWRMTDGRFHDVGLRSTLPGHRISGPDPDSRAMKTPGLRGVRLTAPYMHNGSLPTLRAVVDHYAGGLTQRPSLAPELKRGIQLDDAERRALVAFLRTL